MGFTHYTLLVCHQITQLRGDGSRSVNIASTPLQQSQTPIYGQVLFHISNPLNSRLDVVIFFFLQGWSFLNFIKFGLDFVDILLLIFSVKSNELVLLLIHKCFTE